MAVKRSRPARAWSPGARYAYAPIVDRPPIRLPGDARVALAGYPELGNVPGRRVDVWTEWGVCEQVALAGLRHAETGEVLTGKIPVARGGVAV